MPKMAFRTFLFSSNHINTSLQKGQELLTRISLIYNPVALDKRLQLREEFFDGVQIQ